MKPITSNNPLLLSHAHLYEALRGLQSELKRSERFKRLNVDKDFSLLLVDAQAAKAILYADETLKGN